MVILQLKSTKLEKEKGSCNALLFYCIMIHVLYYSLLFIITGVGQKQGGIMAVKDTKADSDSAGGTSSPMKTTVLGKRPIATSSTPVTPMKLVPKLVSPQMRGGLVKMNPSPRGATSTATGPRPLILPNPRPGLVRNTVPSGIRPAASPRMPTVLGENVFLLLFVKYFTMIIISSISVLLKFSETLFGICRWFSRWH